MTSQAFDYDPLRRRQRPPAWIGYAVLAAILAAVALILVLRGPAIGERQNARTIINIVLPPPPPPPPPEETPLEPEPPKVIEQPLPQPTPQPTPPSPTSEASAAPASDAPLTARVGTTGNNFGLTAGNGGGARIGGAPPVAGDPFAAYAGVALADIRRAAQGDPALARGRYRVRLAVTVSPEGRITNVRLLEGTGDARRDAAIQQRLSGLQLSQRPPDGLPVMRIELNAAGA